MANKAKGIVDIELGGTNYRLQFDFNAICELEDYFDRPAQQVFDESKGIGMREIRGTLWVGLQRHHKGVTVDEVGEWLGDAVNNGQFEQLANTLGSAIAYALHGGKPEELEEAAGKNEEPPKKGAKKGSTSRRSSNKPGVSE